MKKNRKGTTRQLASTRLLWLVTFVLVVAACQDDDFRQLQPPAGEAVNFRTQTLDDFATRAPGHTTTGIYAIRSMGIYAGYTSGAWDDTTAPHNFFDNLHVSRTSDAAPWSYANQQLWPSTGNLTFFAYAPHSDSDAYGTGAYINKPLIHTSTGTPTLQYTIATEHGRQVDLLVGTPVKDQTKRDYVTIPLRHALTKIAFSARLANQPAAGVQTRVTHIQLSKLYGSGTISMDGLNRQWTPSGTNNHTYILDNAADGGLNSLPLSDTYQSLTPANGHLFLLPQLLAEGSTGATVTITYETQVGAGAPDVKSFDLELSSAITRFGAGIAYNLMFVIDNDVTFVVAPTPWDNTDVQADIKNRILNVSRIEAPVYPGVATRIYFWSNQPKDSVYVRSVGNLDATGKQPKGAPYTVNDVFQELSLKNAVNLTHRGIDEAQPTIKDPLLEKGEGYIDVLHKLDAAGNPVSPLIDADKRHIWLNASGMLRNIRLYSVIRGNPTERPYVGTFHRWNETGERIVTWAYNGQWTATVIEEPSVGAILLDRLPSPFMLSGQLYTDSDVGNPEAAWLSPAATVPVSATGRVYLRVGWSTTLASRHAAPRYGVIKISGTNIGGAGKNDAYLYIRQGEQEDYLFGPDATRPYAVKWSPYNLTATTLTNSTQSVAISADRSNATFVKYPTQAGALFQWANATHQRYAYHPVIPAGIPASWDGTIPTNYWNTLMATHENCPPGYRRPTNGIISGEADDTNSEFRQSIIASLTVINSDNMVQGYYADGFFDRRRIGDTALGGRSNSAVSKLTADVAYIGWVAYRTTAPTRSLFFPMPGYRKNNGATANFGSYGYYWLASRTIQGSQHFAFSEIYLDILDSLFPIACSLRCVRDISFGTQLPPSDEIGVPTALGFDADARNAQPTSVLVSALFVEKWNTTMARDFHHYLDPDGTVGKITAKVTFRGTTATGNQDVSTHLFASVLGKVGSAVTYDFGHANLTWTGGTYFTFYVEDGWRATSYAAGSATATQTVDGVANASTPIVLSAKGRVLFTRITAPPVAP